MASLAIFLYDSEVKASFRITKEEVEEEMAMMHKEAEMSVEELKAMYAKMAEENVESEEKVV